MVTLTGSITTKSTPNLRAGLGLWLAVAGTLTTLLVLLSIAIAGNPAPSPDLAVIDWIVGWDAPGLGTFLAAISFLTSAYAGAIYGPVGIAVLLVLKKFRAAVLFGVVGFVVASVAVLGDYTLGAVIGRTRPLADNLATSFPSGHVFGSTVFFGFWGFLAIYYGLKRKFLVPVLALFAALILAVGPARIYDQAHWPSDVAAGYLLGALWLMIIIPVFLRLRGVVSSSTQANDSETAPLPSPEGTRVARSIASYVVLDPKQGTATKVYTPPLVVRFLYWLAFQAKFPYTQNLEALQSGTYRRTIAGFLTAHRFGKNLVSPVTSIECVNGRYTFNTEFIPGELVDNDANAKSFLVQVTETFAEAGLSVWQINPRNPHAHTNLIRTPEGDMKIIDLESAIVTPFPAPGQWRSVLKSGNFPIFDDIDFPRMRNYVSTNAAALEGTIGSDGLAEFNDAIDRAEKAISSWKDSEPRLWGKLTRTMYRLLNWQAAFRRLSGAMAGADQMAERFLNNGIERWTNEGRITSSEAVALRSQLSTGEGRDALHHLGAHLVLTAIFRFPFGSPVRFAWTLAFWGVAVSKRFRGSGTADNARSSNFHSPLVMVLSLIPGFGGVAYLAARPLRRKLLVRFMLDQVAWKLPFKLYRRLRLGRLLAPAPKTAAPQDVRPAPVYAPLATSNAFVQVKETKPDRVPVSTR